MFSFPILILEVNCGLNLAFDEQEMQGVPVAKMQSRSFLVI